MRAVFREVTALPQRIVGNILSVAFIALFGNVGFECEALGRCLAI